MEDKNEKTKWYQTFTVKMAVLGFMTLILLIPLEMVKDVIRDRIHFSDQAKKEITQMWSGQQTISGPVLNVPVYTYEQTKDGNVMVTNILHLLPEELNISGTVKPELRKKSIYRSVVYTSDLQLSGNFKQPDLSSFSGYHIQWKDAYFTFGISDNRGIKGNLKLKVNDKTVEPKPGVADHDLFKSGITFEMPVDTSLENLAFTMNLELNGSDELSFLPIGKSTDISIKSPWADPSFKGDFLPYKREVTKEGFDAHWKVTELNRTFPQIWKGKAYNVNQQSLGIEFLLMADHYQKSLRSVKYGLLFIILTFLVLIFSELFYHNRIQLFHYILVAFALILFFSLLTALSEQIGFSAAYLVSAVLIVSAIWFFTRGFINSPKVALILNGILVLFYVFIFILLSLKDYAYLAGNIGLFIILTTVMGVSRKLKINDK
ncbi:cell envelope integrity protein CreD [Saccharicrinis sp. FJH62]|uniref:cell envelope integrity protein CreD n=1 Tax=Saccharicrinis sp. FJH62 TaxID=3344657 RepID=UPI0035D4F305